MVKSPRAKQGQALLLTDERILISLHDAGSCEPTSTSPLVLTLLRDIITSSGWWEEKTTNYYATI